MTDTPRKRAQVLRPFNDIGTGERFAAGASITLDDGRFANYAAAGLVAAAPAPAVETPTAKPAPKAKRKVPAKPKAGA